VKRTWTHAEIGQFYAAKNRGAYEGSDEHRALAKEYEEDIFLAQREGRVV
jgi:hypothetical protein